MKWVKRFKKTVWGTFEVEANSKEEAEQKFNDAEYDEMDNKSDYELDEAWVKDE